MKRSVLPLMVILVAAPFFADYREEPLKFGILQGVLVAAISVAAAGGLDAFRDRLRKAGFAAFWIAVLGLAVGAPFLMQIFRI